jgi:hypothetical protein
VNLDDLAKIEETGKTVDIVAHPQANVEIWSQPMIIGLLIGVGVSVLLNGILLVLLLAR